MTNHGLVGFVKFLLFYILILIFISGCSSANNTSEEPVPLTPLDNYNKDTVEVFNEIGKMLEGDEIRTFSKVIEDYLDKYDDNPRLNKEQEDIVSDIRSIQILFVQYDIFTFDENYSRANKSIKLIFDIYKGLEKKISDILEDENIYLHKNVEKEKQAKKEASPIKIEDFEGEVSENYIYVTGAVKNMDKIPHSDIKVKVIFYDRYGDVLHTDWTYAATEELKPGEQKYFSMIVQLTGKMKEPYAMGPMVLEIMDYD